MDCAIVRNYLSKYFNVGNNLHNNTLHRTSSASASSAFRQVNKGTGGPIKGTGIKGWYLSYLQNCDCTGVYERRQSLNMRHQSIITVVRNVSTYMMNE